jgi:hypothetical protein
MIEHEDDHEGTTVEVEFDQQQDFLLEKLRRAGRHGTTDEEIIRMVFREFLRQHEADPRSR